MGTTLRESPQAKRLRERAKPAASTRTNTHEDGSIETWRPRALRRSPPWPKGAEEHFEMVRAVANAPKKLLERYGAGARK